MSEDQCHVFVVDDDAAIRRSMERSLTKHGYCVETFDSAAAFLARTTPGDSGCLILDLAMPGMNGLELQEALTKNGTAFSIIFITGHGDIPQSVQALKAGAIDFLEKPFRQKILLERLEEACADASRRQETVRRTHEADQRFSRLTRREWQVMELMTASDGSNSSKEIARELGISHRTIEHHRARIMEKTQARSVTELANMASITRVSMPPSD